MSKLALLSVLFAAGCLADGVVGSNADFSSVDNSSNVTLALVADANWTFGADANWDVACDKSPIDVVVVTIKGGNLSATSTAALLGDDCTLSVREAPIRVITIGGDGPIVSDGPCTGLQTLHVTGNGDITLGTVRADVLDITVSGNGELAISDIDANDLILHLTGNGDATLAGKADKGEFTIGGSGTVDAGQLVIGTLDITVFGSGDATVNVTDSITGEVDGSGSLTVLGSPTDQNVTVKDGATGVLVYE